MKNKADEIIVGGTTIEPGQRQVIDIPVAPMYTHDDLSITVQAIRGKQPGPTLFISAAIPEKRNGQKIHYIPSGEDSWIKSGTQSNNEIKLLWSSWMMSRRS